VIDPLAPHYFNPQNNASATNAQQHSNIVSTRYRDQQPASVKNATNNLLGGQARNTFNIASKFANGAPY